MNTRFPVCISFLNVETGKRQWWAQCGSKNHNSESIMQIRLAMCLLSFWGLGTRSLNVEVQQGNQLSNIRTWTRTMHSNGNTKWVRRRSKDQKRSIRNQTICFYYLFYSESIRLKPRNKQNRNEAKFFTGRLERDGISNKLPPTGVQQLCPTTCQCWEHLQHVHTHHWPLHEGTNQTIDSWWISTSSDKHRKRSSDRLRGKTQRGSAVTQQTACSVTPVTNSSPAQCNANCRYTHVTQQGVTFGKLGL